MVKSGPGAQQLLPLPGIGLSQPIHPGGTIVRRVMRIAARTVLPAALAMALAPRVARAQTLVIDSTSGPITAHELEAFKAFMQTRNPPPNTWGGPGEHNAMA